MPKVFISHSWEDNDISRKLADNLRRDGAEVWIDFLKIKAGDSFIKRMNEGLEWCDTFVLLWSKSAANSNFVSMEWEGALANNLKIIPCLIDKTKLPFILSGRIYKDLSNFYKGYISLAKDFNLVQKEEKTKKLIFRNIPQELSVEEVIEMIKKYDFFDYDDNENGKGFDNLHEQKTIKGDKIVFDKASGLMWQQSGSQAEMVIEDVENCIKELNENGFAGFNDWRLPTLEEAMSLIAPKEKNDLYINPVFDSEISCIWTSDHKKDDSLEWIVDFVFGRCDWSESSYYYVRAVRSVQLSQE